MSDIHFEEHCPCGNTIKVSGYESRVLPRVTEWHKVHDKHSNAIAKTLARSEPTKTPFNPWTATLEKAADGGTGR